MASSGEWEQVTVLRKKAPKAAQLKSTKAVNAAQRQGIPIETNRKFNAATNKQHTVSLNTAKLDRETEELHHDTVGLDVGKLIQQHRQAKGLTQKDLATKICEKAQIVTEYESGKAIPNQQILAKLERTLGVKLRGKDKGQPLGEKKK
ncbi:Endothelial differentiation-related factor 1-like protein [Dinothrombium tinctorium]|uniref:Endothelial differentiation-related factor 1-like protein n=1 Tax=Dinothrombium tinctorium TaxID=1965070 RepID=A0A443RMV0_9ACAR|nr:Endothelial differentiation-related factor 1-like protein [Dinothrombium tinctorium]